MDLQSQHGRQNAGKRSERTDQNLHNIYEKINMEIGIINCGKIKKNACRKIQHIIIYHNFLPTPRRGSHVKSDKTHTQSSRYTT